MIRKNTLPELLAPAGSMEALYAAVEAGADAVYVGGTRFGARAFAKNFDDGELELAVRYCHLHGVKLYVTVNTLVFDRELDGLAEYAAFLYGIGTDAVIVQDLGALGIIRERVPELELHASTQMSVHNTEGTRTAARLGCSRVVLARELPYTDICEITRECPTETEVFLHGALCVCHSGQCLFSSLVGGRSGNRGECAQPCRLPYNGGYPLSLSDLSLATHVRELIASGVASLKIEGRMKSADYVYGVTRIYRRLLDEGRDATAKEMTELARIFSRGGFTDGYFTGRLARMTGVRSDADKTDTRALAGRQFLPKKKRVSAKARFVIGERAEMTLTDGVREVTVQGDEVQRAISAPLTASALCERLARMGNTLLALAEDDVELELDGGANLPIGAINALRRAAAEKFESTSRPIPPDGRDAAPCTFETSRMRTALFLRPKTLTELSAEELSGFDAVFAPLFSDDEVFETANGAYLPPVLRNSDIQAAKERLEELRGKGVSYALVGNLSHIELSLSSGLVPIADIRMNTANSMTRRCLYELGVRHTIVSAELDLPRARDIGGGVTVYGRIPLMLTERCFTKESFSCSECSHAALIDRMGKRFYLMREYEHRNIILNSQITYMADRSDDIVRSGLSEHFIFSIESAAEVRSVLSAYAKKLPIEAVFRGESPRRLGIRSTQSRRAGR